MVGIRVVASVWLGVVWAALLFACLPAAAHIGLMPGWGVRTLGGQMPLLAPFGFSLVFVTIALGAAAMGAADLARRMTWSALAAAAIVDVLNSAALWVVSGGDIFGGVLALVVIFGRELAMIAVALAGPLALLEWRRERLREP